jgi:hypothetical protein
MDKFKIGLTKHKVSTRLAPIPEEKKKEDDLPKVNILRPEL